MSRDREGQVYNEDDALVVDAEDELQWDSVVAAVSRCSAVDEPCAQFRPGHLGRSEGGRSDLLPPGSTCVGSLGSNEQHQMASHSNEQHMLQQGLQTSPSPSLGNSSDGPCEPRLDAVPEDYALLTAAVREAANPLLFSSPTLPHSPITMNIANHYGVDTGTNDGTREPLCSFSGLQFLLGNDTGKRGSSGNSNRVEDWAERRARRRSALTPLIIPDDSIASSGGTAPSLAAMPPSLANENEDERRRREVRRGSASRYGGGLDRDRDDTAASTAAPLAILRTSNAPSALPMSCGGAGGADAPANSSLPAASNGHAASTPTPPSAETPVGNHSNRGGVALPTASTTNSTETVEISGPSATTTTAAPTRHVDVEEEEALTRADTARTEGSRDRGPTVKTYVMVEAEEEETSTTQQQQVTVVPTLAVKAAQQEDGMDVDPPQRKRIRLCLSRPSTAVETPVSGATGMTPTSAKGPAPRGLRLGPRPPSSSLVASPTGNNTLGGPQHQHQQNPLQPVGASSNNSITVVQGLDSSTGSASVGVFSPRGPVDRTLAFATASSVARNASVVALGSTASATATAALSASVHQQGQQGQRNSADGSTISPPPFSPLTPGRTSQSKQAASGVAAVSFAAAVQGSSGPSPHQQQQVTQTLAAIAPRPSAHADPERLDNALSDGTTAATATGNTGMRDEASANQLPHQVSSLTRHAAARSLTPTPAYSVQGTPRRTHRKTGVTLPAAPSAVDFSCVHKVVEDQYVLSQKISEGTYGEVYIGLDKATGEKVALKRLKTLRGLDGFPITSLREVIALQHISRQRRRLHEQLRQRRPQQQKDLPLAEVVTLRDVLLSNNDTHDIFLVFDYASSSLAGLLSRRVPFTVSEVAYVFRRLVLGVRQLHEMGIIHRDIKSDNILLRDDAGVLIADFGLCVFEGSHRSLTPSMINLSYRPPEMLLGSTLYDEKVDVWSIGCMLAQMFLLTPPFHQPPRLPTEGEPQLHKNSRGADTELEQLAVICEVLGPLSTVAPGAYPEKACKHLARLEELRAAYSAQTGTTGIFSSVSSSPSSAVGAEAKGLARLQPLFDPSFRYSHYHGFRGWFLAAMENRRARHNQAAMTAARAASTTVSSLPPLLMPTHECLDVLCAIFRLDPRQRPTTVQLAQMPFFQLQQYGGEDAVQLGLSAKLREFPDSHVLPRT